MSLAERQKDFVPQLIDMLKSSDLYTRLGACQALAKIKGKAAPAIPDLRKTLQAEDMWLRIKAVEALAAIGQPAMVALPEMLALFNQNNPDDPRGMQQRYLCFAIFNRRGGLLGNSLHGIAPEDIYEAVKIGLKNEDGRARGALSSVYRLLSYEQIKPLLPFIKEAIVTPSKSGIMFQNEIRTQGLELFARHKIRDGLDLAVEYIINQKAHGSAKRVPKALKCIEQYGVHAKAKIPRLEEIANHFEKVERNKDKTEMVRKGIEKIKTLTKNPQLISL